MKEMATKDSSAEAKKKVARRRKVKAKVPRFTTEELNEQFDIALSTCNPYMSENCVEFDLQTGECKPNLAHLEPVYVLKIKGSMRKRKPEGDEILMEEFEEMKKKEGKRGNKFTLRSVGEQTAPLHASDHGNGTDASLMPVLKFRRQVSKAVIHAAYERHEKKKEEKHPLAWVSKLVASGNYRKYTLGKKTSQVQDSDRKMLRLCERMIDQNLSEAHLDYSYYDSDKDTFNPKFGNLLPLWRFSCSLTRELPVTDIIWSFRYSDLFAVSYRTFKDEADEYDLGMIREKGVVSVYSLKCPSYPEKIMESEAAVRCLSFHPKFPNLLATGCEGGILNVYDLRRELNDPAGTSKMTEKIVHFDTVNKVTWLSADQKLVSVSEDGKVLSWKYLLNDLFLYDDVMPLEIKDCPSDVPPTGHEAESEPSPHQVVAQELGINMAGTSMCLNPRDSDLLMVGTEIGVIYKYSYDEKRQLDSYEEHKRTVLRIDPNPYHQNVFLSASDDMTVRIWDHSMRESVFEFFFESEVRDACWAPFSSTLFAVISGTSVLYVYDLAVNKKEATCIYPVFTAKERIKLTKVCFHPTEPVLMVGDERGCVHSFKLSPNLRSSLPAFKSMNRDKFTEGEIQKMEKLIAPAKGRIKRN